MLGLWAAIVKLNNPGGDVSMTNTDNFEAGLEYHQATKTLFILTPAFSTTTLSNFSRAPHWR
jgi:restriction endonuclease Mrr